MARDALAEFDDNAELMDKTAPEAEPTSEEPVPEPQPEPEPQEAAEPEPQPEGEPGPAPETEPGPEPVPYDRFEDVNKRMQHAEQQRDELMRMMLDKSGPQQQEQTAEEPQVEVDPEVETMVMPLLKREMGNLRQGMDQIIARDQHDREMGMLENLMPGFKADYLDKVQDEFKRLPPEQQQHFDSPAGALALAGIIKAREGGQTVSPEQTSATQTLANRAHSEGRAHAPARSGQMTPDDISRMSDAEFTTMIARLKGDSTPDSGIDSLLR